MIRLRMGAKSQAGLFSVACVGQFGLKLYEVGPNVHAAA